MTRGIFSIVGLVIILILLVQTMQGKLGFEDVAVRGLVIVAIIAVIDKIVVPLVGAAIDATSVEGDDEATAAASSRGDTTG